MNEVRSQNSKMSCLSMADHLWGPYQLLAGRKWTDFWDFVALGQHLTSPTHTEHHWTEFARLVGPQW